MGCAPRSARGALSRGAFFLVLFAAACVLVPGLFWWGTTFTRSLDDDELVERLRPDASPREVQHAIEEISRRFEEGRPGMDRWADELVRVSARREESVRISAAWCMQFDAERPVFQARLREMVRDDQAPMVRRNAATSLAKGGDAAALPELRAMLAPFVVVSPADGVAHDLLPPDSSVEEGTRVGSVETDAGGLVDVRAPVPGVVSDQLVREGDRVYSGRGVVRLRPADEHMQNALYALSLVGEAKDLERLRSLLDPRSGASEGVRQAATWAIQGIESRAR